MTYSTVRKALNSFRIRPVAPPLATLKKETIHFLLFQVVTHSILSISLSLQEALSASVPLSFSSARYF